jgi:hypothetical protein
MHERNGVQVEVLRDVEHDARRSMNQDLMSLGNV